jgi:hypothetical protein
MLHRSIRAMRYVKEMSRCIVELAWRTRPLARGGAALYEQPPSRRAESIVDPPADYWLSTARAVPGEAPGKSSASTRRRRGDGCGPQCLVRGPLSVSVTLSGWLTLIKGIALMAGHRGRLTHSIAG